jgi:hypothetical protein
MGDGGREFNWHGLAKGEKTSFFTQQLRQDSKSQIADFFVD